MISTESKTLNFSNLEENRREKGKPVEFDVVVKSEAMNIIEKTDVVSVDEFKMLIEQLCEYYRKKRYINFLKFDKGFVLEVEDY